MSRRILPILLLAALSSVVRAEAAPPETLTIAPGDITLQGPRARQALLVTGGYGAAGEADLTREAAYESTQPQVAAVGPNGVVTPKGDGTAEIVARFAGKEARVKVTVRGFASPSPVDFRTDVIAALSHVGCNAGTCHGSPQGKNGFHLSLRGYDPESDFQTLTRDSIGRRTDALAPDDSLMLLKPTGRTAHGGGVLLRPDDPAYRTIHFWIAEGCRDSAATAKVERLEVLPDRRRLHTDAPRQQIVVRAHFQSGEVRDVTELAVFTSSKPGVATVTPAGLVEFKQTADMAVLVRYLDRIESARLTYVHRDPAYTFAGPAPANYVDEHVFARQRELQLNPAPQCSDAVFLRRVFLDVIGALPTADEARAFLDSMEPDKRAKLIDTLLTRDEYADFWALKWADVMRGSTTTISERGVHSFHRYLVRTMAEDRPMDAFARELLTGQGDTLHRPEANFHRISTTPEETAETVAQLFMGVRVQCAKCHNHPFESITQADYYGLAAYFARVQRKPVKFGLDDQIIFLAPSGEVRNPTTKKAQEPAAFGAPAGKLGPDDDPRERLADWLTRADNPYFAPSIVNRVWFHLLGRGIVDPVDDFRATNPASNPELLKALSDDFVKGGFRLKPVLRTILNSKTYQLAAQGGPVPSPFAADPDRYFTHAAVKMLSAEQVLDGVCAATGVPEAFKGYPLGTHAVELAEGGVSHPFLQAFSKPVRDASCECAREDDPSLPEALHLLNNADVLAKITAPKSRLAGWLHDGKSTSEIVELMVLAAVSRRPTTAEIDIVNQHIAGLKDDREKGLQDLEFALINSGEFLLRH